MNNKIITIAAIIFFVKISGQIMPYQMGPLPIGTKIDNPQKLDLFDNSESILYRVVVNENSNLIMISTDGLSDVILIPKNSFGGGEIYRKLEDGNYVRIIECRKVNNGADIYKVDENNISTKIFGVDGADPVNALMIGYRLYWSNIHDQVFNQKEAIELKE